MDIPLIKSAINIQEASQDVLLWVETQLAVGEYLAQDQVNGLIGQSTLDALAKFKQDSYLDYPQGLGPSTIEALAELQPKDAVSEQAETVPMAPLKEACTKSGKSVVLPLVGKVWANEEIVEGSKLLWREMLRDFSRLPKGSNQYGSEEQLIRNMIALAKVFAIVRDKFGSPIGINSAYRPFTLPIGASRSQHKYARALDMRPMNGDFKKLLQVLRAVDGVKGIGLGAKKGFLHGDIRPGNRVTFSY